MPIVFIVGQPSIVDWFVTIVLRYSYCGGTVGTCTGPDCHKIYKLTSLPAVIENGKVRINLEIGTRTPA